MRDNFIRRAPVAFAGHCRVKPEIRKMHRNRCHGNNCPPHWDISRVSVILQKKLISAKDRNAVDCYCCHSKFYARARISWKYINIFWISHGFEVRFHFSGFVMIFFSGASKLLLSLQFCRFWMQCTVVTFIIDFANVFKSAYSHFRAFAGTLQWFQLLTLIRLVTCIF